MDGNGSSTESGIGVFVLGPAGSLIWLGWAWSTRNTGNGSFFLRDVLVMRDGWTRVSFEDEEEFE